MPPPDAPLPAPSGPLPEVWTRHPALAQLDAAERDAVLATLAQPLAVPAGTLLFEEGGRCAGFPLLLRGEIRVARGSPQGRTLELYRVLPGELCVVSTTCLQSGAPLFAHAVSTQPCELLLLQRAGLERWLAHAGFRTQLIGSLAGRLADLMQLVEAVAFQRLDQRLAGALLGRGPALALTHQALADEIGTVREIVSRLLRRFEQQGWVALARGHIRVLDAPALRALAAGGLGD